MNKKFQVLEVGNYWTHADGRIIRERFWRKPPKDADPHGIFRTEERQIIVRPPLKERSDDSGA